MRVITETIRSVLVETFDVSTEPGHAHGVHRMMIVSGCAGVGPPRV